MRSRLFVVASCLLLAGCSPTGEQPDAVESPLLSTAADSLAFFILEGAGGLAAWESLDALRFDWAVERGGAEVIRVRHLWDRRTDRYRVEYPIGTDSVVVAVFRASTFDPDAPIGQAFLTGAPVDSTTLADHLNSAYERFINDTYWLLAPLKVFDPGVIRRVVPDSADAGSRVLELAFEGVGLTPGDRYWLRVGDDGRVQSWSFELESGREGYFVWLDFESLATPGGELVLASRKQGGDVAILTEVLPTDAPSDDIFADPHPRL